MKPVLDAFAGAHDIADALAEDVGVEDDAFVGVEAVGRVETRCEAGSGVAVVFGAEEDLVAGLEGAEVGDTASSLMEV